MPRAHGHTAHCRVPPSSAPRHGDTSTPPRHGDTSTPPCPAPTSGAGRTGAALCAHRAGEHWGAGKFNSLLPIFVLAGQHSFREETGRGGGLPTSSAFLVMKVKAALWHPCLGLAKCEAFFFISRPCNKISRGATFSEQKGARHLTPGPQWDKQTIPISQSPATQSFYTKSALDTPPRADGSTGGSPSHL